MRKVLLGAWVVAVTLLAPVAPAAAAPALVVLDLTVDIAASGVGATSASIQGRVVAGWGGFTSGAVVDGEASVFEPAASCPATGTAMGTLKTDDGYATSFTWTRVGAAAVVTTAIGSGTGAFVVTDPVGNPCGQRVTAKLRAAIVVDQAPPPDPFLLLHPMGAEYVYGEVTITDVGDGPSVTYSGDLVTGCRNQWDSYGRVVYECPGWGGRLPRLGCARVEALAKVFPTLPTAGDGSGFGRVTATAHCLQQTWGTAATADAWAGRPVTQASGPGSGVAYGILCIAERSRTGPPAPPMVPYRVACRMFA